MTQTDGYRPLTDAEGALLQKLLEGQFPGRSDLIYQLQGLKVEQVDSAGSLRFRVAHGRQAQVRSNVVAEARYPDLNTRCDTDAHVNIILHVRAGKLFILEVYKDDGSPILRGPSAGAIGMVWHR